MEVSLESFKKRFTYDPLRDLLGKGGFGEVYKAYDNEDKCYVALKIYSGTGDNKYALINEVKRFKRLRHPNIIEHIEAYEVTTGNNDIHGKPIIYQIGILEYADGGTLADLLKIGIPDRHLLEDLAKDILEGLKYLHQNNIIHRDLKPSNILLYKEGDTIRAKITDFGIAKQTDVTSHSTQIIGTVEYMAPEFFTDSTNLSPAADIWSFGVILLEAVTGTHAFGKTSTGSANEQVIHNILTKDLQQTLQSVPVPFREIITRCLVRDPAVRADADVLIRMLSNEGGDNFNERTQVIMPKSKANKKSKKFIINKRSIRNILLCVLVIGILISGYLLFNHYRIESRVLVPIYSSTGYYGFKDAKTGEIVIPLKYDYADSFYDGRAKVIIGGRFGFINNSGDTIIKPIYYDAHHFREGLAVVGIKKDGDILYGYIDKYGKEIITPQYIDANNFFDQYALVSNKQPDKNMGNYNVMGETLYGIINKNGIEIIPIKFTNLQRDSFCVIVSSGENYGMYDYSGKELLGVRHHRIYFNQHNTYLVWDKEKGGIVDCKGKEILPIVYNFIIQLGNNYLVEQMKDRYILNKDRKVIMRLNKDDDADSFCEGIFSVKQNGKWALYNEDGKCIIPVKYDFIGRMTDDGLAPVRYKTSDTSGIAGYIDKNGKEIIPLKYEAAESFQQGVAPVKLNGKWGCIDKKGNQVIPFIYDHVRSNFHDPYGWDCTWKNHVFVWLNEKIGVININGSVVFPCIYDAFVGPDEYGRIFALKDGFIGVIDTLGQIIIPFEYPREENYNHILYSRHGLYLLTKNDKYGVIDYNGLIVLQFSKGYKSIRGDQLIEDLGDDDFKYFNRTGKLVIEFKL